jgi:hypothetical protein
VEFDFVSISGSRKPAYLRHLGFTIGDADHHIEDWTFILRGDKAMHAHFDLERRKEGLGTPAGK